MKTNSSRSAKSQAIDYLNFVKPWDEKYKHDTQTNVKQFLRWKQLYEASGCQVPECWPKQAGLRSSLARGTD